MIPLSSSGVGMGYHSAHPSGTTQQARPGGVGKAGERGTRGGRRRTAAVVVAVVVAVAVAVVAVAVVAAAVVTVRVVRPGKQMEMKKRRTARRGRRGRRGRSTGGGCGGRREAGEEGDGTSQRNGRGCVETHRSRRPQRRRLRCLLRPRLHPDRDRLPGHHGAPLESRTRGDDACVPGPPRSDLGRVVCQPRGSVCHRFARSYVCVLTVLTLLTLLAQCTLGAARGVKGMKGMKGMKGIKGIKRRRDGWLGG